MMSRFLNLQGNTLFEFEFERRAFMTSAVSVNGLFIVVPSVDKSGDVLNVYHAKTGTYINCFTPKYNEFSDAHNLIPMPHDVSVSSFKLQKVNGTTGGKDLQNKLNVH